MTGPADTTPPPSDLPEVGRITLHELLTVLKMGLYDFRRAPLYGLFFSLVYVVAGFALVMLGADTFGWTLVVSLGFPLVAPFAAVGLYEVSRRLEAAEPLDWVGVLGVVAAERRRQIPWVGAILVIAFLFWTFLAHMIFALFMGLSAMTNVSSSLEILLTREGLTMLAVEMAVGGAFAFLLFSLTVVSLPLLLEKELDFITAMLLSLEVVKANPVVMMIWALILASLLILGMLPAFLGLFIVLPVLGHASWHLYRRALYHAV